MSTLSATRDPEDDAFGRGVMRRVMRHLMPFIMLCYFIAYLDRVNVGFASLQMNKAIGLSASSYGFGAGLFFFGYCLCEVPSNLMLYRFGAQRWLARIMVTWGICATAMAFVAGPTSFYVMRTILGMAEAGFTPGILYFLTLWFPEAYRGRVVGMYFAAVPISGIVGSPLSGLLLSLDGTFGLQGWQWLYILEGVPAILLGPAILLYLQESPAAAPWLPAAERNWLTVRLASETRQREKRHAAGLLKALTNPLVWGLGMIYFTNVSLNNAIALFLPQIIKGFGASNRQIGLIAAIPSCTALIAVLWLGRRSDRKQERHGHAAAANFVGGAALLISALLQDPTSRVAALSVSMAGTMAFSAVFWTIPAGFLTGVSAAGGLAAVSAMGILGGFVTPWFVGVLKDVTGDFRWGLGLVGCVAMLAAGVLWHLRRWQPHDPQGAVPSPGRKTAPD